MVRLHRVCVAMHVPVAQILTRDRRFLFQNCGNPNINGVHQAYTTGAAHGNGLLTTSTTPTTACRSASESCGNVIGRRSTLPLAKNPHSFPCFDMVMPVTCSHCGESFLAAIEPVLDKRRVREEETGFSRGLLFAWCALRHVHALQELWAVIGG
jgi:hypothetical protein